MAQTSRESRVTKTERTNEIFWILLVPPPLLDIMLEYTLRFYFHSSTLIICQVYEAPHEMHLFLHFHFNDQKIPENGPPVSSS